MLACAGCKNRGNISFVIGGGPKCCLNVGFTISCEENDAVAAEKRFPLLPFSCHSNIFVVNAYKTNEILTHIL